MKLINLGCGSERPGDPWINVDCYDNYSAHNYVRMDLNVMPWPFEDNSIDGIFASHVFEHFDAVELQKVIAQCYRILKPNGVLRCTVPDASHFRKTHLRDCRENALELYGEILNHADYETFMGWALFLHDGHFQVFTEDSLWCSLVNREYYGVKRESFKPENVSRVEFNRVARPDHYCNTLLAYMDNRPKFSLFMEAYK